jgi:transposase
MRSEPSPGLRGPTGATVPVRLADFGIVAPRARLPRDAKGIPNVDRLLATLEAAPEAARPALGSRAGPRGSRSRGGKIPARAAAPPVPGVGAIPARALAATTPGVEVFRTGRDAAAGLGLPPKAHASGGTARGRAATGADASWAGSR